MDKSGDGYREEDYVVGKGRRSEGRPFMIMIALQF